MKQTQKTRSAVAKFAVSLPKDMKSWLNRKAAKEHGGNVSRTLRALLQPHFDSRHAK
jgi:hypothetical protein